MHKAILKLFEFLKSSTQFIKIVLLFSILMLILYWIQNLTGDFWAWTGFMTPILDVFLNLGHYIAPGSIMLFAAVFEFKFLAALGLIGGLYALTHFSYIGLCGLEELYGEGCRKVRKFEEDCFNAQMEAQNTIEQKKLRRYQIYVETQVKPKYAHREYNINMEEQNQIMLKFLVEKTGNVPEKFENGYLFTFESFGQIDSMLDIFSKMFKSTAPINYIICVQILGANVSKEKEQLKKLIELKMLNKISTMSDTVFRYEFNPIKHYKTVQLGLFQKGNDTFEVHEFISLN